MWLSRLNAKEKRRRRRIVSSAPLVQCDNYLSKGIVFFFLKIVLNSSGDGIVWTSIFFFFYDYFLFFKNSCIFNALVAAVGRKVSLCGCLGSRRDDAVDDCLSCVGGDLETGDRRSEVALGRDWDCVSGRCLGAWLAVTVGGWQVRRSRSRGRSSGSSCIHIIKN